MQHGNTLRRLNTQALQFGPAQCTRTVTGQHGNGDHVALHCLQQAVGENFKLHTRFGIIRGAGQGITVIIAD